MSPKIDPSEAIAIIGIGGVFPAASDIPSFWSNIVGKADCVIEVPKDRWDWRLYYDPDPAAPDKTYSKIGGFIRGFKFDPLKLRIPPPVAAQMDTVQQLAVAATAEALKDSGYDKKSFDPERTAVVLGNSMGGTKKDSSDLRVYTSFYLQQLRESPSFAKLPAASRKAIAAEMETAAKSGLSTINEDTMPGELSNVIAGRVANAFNFNGANFTVDAACASSLAALGQAVNGLRFHEYDLAVSGGVDQMMAAPAYVKFCKIGALSPDGSRPFDAGANGFVMGEGAGVFLLKRLRDALKDGDRIYALIRAVGASSDGRGKGITAPNPKGQRLAIERCFQQLNYGPDGVGLLEAHGTSTKVGDVVEVSSAAEIFKPHAAKRSIGLGSVKSQIGHLKAAAGAASVIKAALALRHKTLPPSINFKNPNPGIDWADSPFFVLTEAQDWRGAGRPRRAHVSSFGFGGTNFHVALEEADAETTSRLPDFSLLEKSGQDTPPVPRLRLAPALGAEAFFIHGGTPDSIFDQLSSLKTKLPAEGIALSRLAHEVNTRSKRGQYTLCLSAESPAKLGEKIGFILRSKDSAAWEKTPPLWRSKGIFLGMKNKTPGKIGFLFPGQGSQYVDMLKDLREKYRIVADAYDEADAIMLDVIGERLTDILFTKGGETAEQSAAMEERIKRTEITQPAVLTADVAMLRLLESYGLKPDVVCGHSLGEYGALVAAGVFTFKDALLAVSSRAKEMAGVKVRDCGKMASIAAAMEKVEPVLKRVDGYVAAANKNCPIQTVIAGETRSVEAAIKKFAAMGIQAAEIRVSHAFHSRIVEPAQAPYSRFLERMPLKPPSIPLLSNVTAAYYPQDLGEIRKLLVAQIASPVEFIRQIERMYEDGVRVFVEAGPKRVLSAFATSILEGKKDAVILSSNHPKRGGILEFNELLARLTAEGIDLRLADKDPASSKAFNPVFSSWVRGDSSLPEKTAAASPAPAPACEPPSLFAEPPASMPSSGAGRFERWGFETGPVVISGIAAGTPGDWDRVFREDNLDLLIRGQNLIGKLSEADIERQIDKNIVRLVKSDSGDHRLERIESAAEVVKLAGLAGEFDLVKEFGFKESIAHAMDVSSRLAVAAGILALKDAGIPLVRRYKDTTTGSKLPAGWGLPPALRDETGVIFATAYPSLDSMASEISRYLADKFRRKPMREFSALVESLVSRLKNAEDRAAVEHWAAAHLSLYQERFGSEGPYEFSRDFLLRVMPLGHSQLAQWIGARGPCAQISAACASTTQAVAMAEDWLRLGRAKRVVVIAGDDVTSPNLREWTLSGFLAAGAATTTGIVSEAALPFDRRRHGMILGMGAAGLVVETGAKTAERGMKPLVEILAGEFMNSAFHATRLEQDHVAQVMERLVAKAERRHGLSRRDIAAKALFMSHETYTPARGGSASAEVEALKRTFGPDAPRIIVTNTKGYTGHSMGASIEDPVAIRALVTGQAPAIANYKEADPDLAGITLSRGGEYDLEYAIRLGAGFGSQIAMTLMRRVLRKGESRIGDPESHRRWLGAVAGRPDPELEVVENTLRVKDTGAPVSAPAQPAFPPAHRPVSIPSAAAYRPAAAGAFTPPAAATASPIDAAAVRTPASSPVVEEEVRRVVVALVGEKTGYPAEMLELDLDMEADLGIDTVKQAELIGILREKYSIPNRENLALKDYPTLRHVIRFVLSSAGSSSAAARAAAVVEPGPDLSAPMETSSSAGFKRWIVEPRERPLPPGSGRPLSKKGAAVVLSLDAAEAKPFVDALKAAGVAAVVVSKADWSDAEDVAAAARKAAGKQGPQGILDLCGLSLGDFKRATARSFDAAYLKTARPLFVAAKALQGGLQEGWIAAVTRGPHPLGGAVAGLAKALSREFPKAKVLSIDFHAEAKRSEMAKALLAELRGTDTAVEVLYRDGKRWTLRLSPAELSAAGGRALGPKSVVVVTGGGGGIGAECAKELARRCRARLVIVGRTPLEPMAADWAALDAAGLKALKQELWEKLKADKSRKATPALLEREFAKTTKAADLHRNLEAMRAAGAKTDYVAGDLADEETAKAVAGELGGSAADLVLHAAGLEESKLLADKTAERFDAVFRAKAHGAFHLLKRLKPKDGQRWVFFSSVVGRFGNAGQTDYAAASEFLSRLSAWLRRNGRKAVTVDLTAVSGVGMATRGGAELFLKSQGVDFMPPSVAVRMILEEAAGGMPDGEVALAGSLGKLETGAERGTLSLSPERGENDARGSIAQDGGRRALIDGMLKEEAGREMVSVKEFSLAAEPWLADHSIGGVPYVPGVMGLELFAETAAKLLGNVPAGFEDVRFALPMKLLRNKPLKVRTYATAKGGDVELRIESDFLTPQGIKLGAPKIHFTARKLRKALPGWEGEKSPIPRGAKFVAGAKDIYSAYFHGPSFHVLEGIASLTEREIIAACRRPEKPLWAQGGKDLKLPLMLIEAAFQTCGYRDIRLAGKMTLPDSIGAVQVLSFEDAIPEKFYVRALFKGPDATGRSVYDAWVFAEGHALLARLLDYRMIAVS